MCREQIAVHGLFDLKSNLIRFSYRHCPQIIQNKSLEKQTEEEEEMKWRMRGHVFETQQHLADFCTEFAERQSEDKLKSIFNNWQQRCLKVIDNGGEYLF
ncbi:MAG: hypothetical protein EZS28_040022 [Streblomastix strix]|uniref:Uncharacterized protein n=1 Tax=Streblomastix strix TaxID=222440 RepID=A0A5J4U3D0_9EUKA|nr:MAG: hypothetical protein EZS28_040022 [Streblomastix strix]